MEGGFSYSGTVQAKKKMMEPIIFLKINKILSVVVFNNQKFIDFFI